MDGDAGMATVLAGMMAGRGNCRCGQGQLRARRCRLEARLGPRRQPSPSWCRDALLAADDAETIAAAISIKVSRRNGGMVPHPIYRVPLLTAHTASHPEPPLLPDPPNPPAP